jgi:hypothetical protein
MVHASRLGNQQLPQMVISTLSLEGTLCNVMLYWTIGRGLLIFVLKCLVLQNIVRCLRRTRNKPSSLRIVRREWEELERSF